MAYTLPGPATGFDLHCSLCATAPPEDMSDHLLISRRRVGLALSAWGLAIGAAETAWSTQGRAPTADSDMITADTTSFQSDME